eukprot:gnl/Ergobibamus_cyprinoides/4162.p1 GENE.gnl/Ergobibamus_cyprinoides/4162~~gnl/Ergobibamus_cyprinoides/4162.p1  ORF type:complete len:147 (+),score=11.94 gnl/Ergobibamus_cyprinoides/4162:69-509(+)
MAPSGQALPFPTTLLLSPAPTPLSQASSLPTAPPTPYMGQEPQGGLSPTAVSPRSTSGHSDLDQLPPLPAPMAKRLSKLTVPQLDREKSKLSNRASRCERELLDLQARKAELARRLRRFKAPGRSGGPSRVSLGPGGAKHPLKRTQ